MRVNVATIARGVAARSVWCPRCIVVCAELTPMLSVTSRQSARV